MESEVKRWLKIAEAARHVSMSVGFLRKAVRHKRIPFARVGNKALRFDREALDNWMANGDGGELTSPSRKS